MDSNTLRGHTQWTHCALASTSLFKHGTGKSDWQNQQQCAVYLGLVGLTVVAANTLSKLDRGKTVEPKAQVCIFDFVFLVEQM